MTAKRALFAMCIHKTLQIAYRFFFEHVLKLLYMYSCEIRKYRKRFRDFYKYGNYFVVYNYLFLDIYIYD